MILQKWTFHLGLFTLDFSPTPVPEQFADAEEENNEIGGTPLSGTRPRHGLNLHEPA